MVEVTIPPIGGGGDSSDGQNKSYSAKLKLNIQRSERLNRKVLEITLETDKGAKLDIEDKDVAKLASRLGIDVKTQDIQEKLSFGLRMESLLTGSVRMRSSECPKVSELATSDPWTEKK